MKTEKIILLIKAIEALMIGWFMTTYVLFLTGNGLNLFQANLVNIAYMTVRFSLDPYTGYLADKFGQKRIYLLGTLVFGLGMLIYGFSKSFGLFMLAEMTGAVGSVMMGEALESWIANFDKVNHSKSYSRIQSIIRLMTIPSAILGGIVAYKFGLQWPWVLAAATSLVLFIVAYFGLKKLPALSACPTEPLGVIKSFKLSWKNSELRFVLITSALVAASFAPINMFWTPILKGAGGEVWWLGFVWVLFACAIALGNYVSHKWLPRTRFGIGLLILGTMSGLLLTPLFAGSFVMIMLLILLHEIGRGGVPIMMFSYSQHHIADSDRTTINSIRSAAGTFGMAVGLLVSGVLTLYLAPTIVWAIVAVIACTYGLMIMKKK